MSQTAPTQETTDEPLPSMRGNWEIEIPVPKDDPRYDALYGLTTLEITFQAPGEHLDRIFGSVNSSPALPSGATSYAIRDGQVSNSPDGNGYFVYFVLRRGSADYTFTGILDSQTRYVQGRTPVFAVAGPGGGAGDGSWSAQAQSGG